VEKNTCGVADKVNQIFKLWRVRFLAICLVFSLLAITNFLNLNPGKGVGIGNGLDYGLDFAGGTQLQLRLAEPVDSNTMAVEKGILENRLNGLGLKDIPVRPWGNQYLLIQVAGASPEETGNIEEILKQQARFEERIDGELAVKGDEITVDLSPQGRTLQKTTSGYAWGVSVQHNKEGACRFGKVAEGKKGRPVDLFIDRPANTTIIFSKSEYLLLSNFTSTRASDDVFFGDLALEVIENRSQIPVFSPDNASHTPLDLKASGFNTVILAGDESEISDSYRNLLEEQGFETSRLPKMNMSYSEWVKQLTGLENSPTLKFNTLGECVYQARITGSSPTLLQAEAELKETQVLLTSGNLPVKLSVESKSTTEPRLGSRFLKYSFITGVIAIFTVALILFIRYRQPKIVAPLVGVGVSEILIILGLASLINWELDLPAVAGIIAAVGTGVDHLIVITDETLKGGVKKKKRQQIVVLTDQIRRAFFIIFTAASTTIAAMLPIMSVGAGMLKGFAFTTIMGVLVGVLIARPTYAKVIEKVMSSD
jgi:preprotein translocase subunit SecD